MDALRVLIVDDDLNFARALKLRCEQISIKAEISSDALHAVTAIQQYKPDLIVLDLNLPGQDGLSTYQKLAKDGKCPPGSIVVLTGQSDEGTVRQCQSLGVQYLLKGPETWPQLEGILRKAQQNKNPASPESPACRGKILSIDDDSAISEALRIRMKPLGVEVLKATDGMTGYWMALQEQPDVIITDYSMPEGEGNYVVSRLAGHTLTRDIPVIVLTGRTNDYSIRRSMLNLGVTAFFTKPLDFDLLRKELERHIDFSGKKPVRTKSPIAPEQTVMC